jgi:hypothetical protein
MTLGRETLLNGLAALMVLAAAAWFVHATEWTDDEVPVPPHGAAAHDDHYAAKQIVQRLGGLAASPQNLDRMPPPGATLVLNSWHWNLFPEREQALRRWVESGGHLVTQAWRRPEWLPIEQKSAPARPASTPAVRPPVLPAPSKPLLGPQVTLPSTACHEVQEPDGVEPAYGTPRRLRVCGPTPGAYLRTASPPRWSLDGPSGPEFLRANLGQGLVTVSLVDVSDNRSLLEGDNALTLVAALRLRPGDTVWFVDSERRPPLLAVIWHTGAPAVLLGGLALALLLWRAGVRFGPGAPTEPPSRRSVAEQIRGTASFIFQRDSAVLHRAQLRALEQAARRIIRDHDRMERRSRAEAIGRATALDAGELARAMDPSLKRPRRELLAALALLETAVRRLSLNP